jgi:hypothetical protein
VKSEKRWFWEVVSRGLRGDFFVWGERVKLSLQGPLEIFSNQERLKNFSVKVRLKIFRAGSDREISGQALLIFSEVSNPRSHRRPATTTLIRSRMPDRGGIGRSTGLLGKGVWMIFSSDPLSLCA